MAFSDFDLRTARERFHLQIDERRDLFAAVEPVEVSDSLRAMLTDWGPLALAMNTEKARSEMIIAPILMEAVRRTPEPVGLFSGMTFDVDKEQSLNGICDYLLTRSLERFYISHPVVAIVEAKKEDIPGGLGQCVAAMVATQLFNEREGMVTPRVYGVVTTGSNWRFLQLDRSIVRIDATEYYLQQVGKILGILTTILASIEPTS